MTGTVLLSIIENFLYSYLPYLSIFIVSLFMPADTDLGWHLKYGEFFSRTGGILRENLFSSEMTSYQWVNISWITDIITYNVYRVGGFWGLSIAGALTVTLTFYLISKALKLSFWEKAFVFPILFFLEEPLFRASFRGQLLSSLFTATLILIISQFIRGKKIYIYLVLPLFLFWGNIHGGFPVGLIILSAYFFLSLLKFYFLKKRAEFKYYLSVLPIVLLAFIAPILNPFGINIYTEVIKHFGNPYQNFILEWLPLPPFSNLWWLLIFWGIFMIITIVEIIQKKKLADYFEWIILLIIIYIASFWMRRYAWSMYILSMPIAAFYFKNIMPSRANFISRALPILVFASVYTYSIFYHIPDQKLNNMNWERYCRDFIKCSTGSAEFLKNSNIKGKLLSNYNWGGWLIWNYPSLKPSIDGRMHLWQDKSGYSAFGKYYYFEQNINDIDKSDYDIVYMSTEKPLFGRMEKLVSENKWKALYTDGLAGVFVRVKK